MRTRTRLLSLTAGLMLAFATTACGGGEEAVNDDNRPYVDAVKESMRAAADDDMEFDDKQIDCLAPRIVNTIGVDKFESAGLTPEEIADDSDMDFSELGLTKDEGNDVYDNFGECDINLREMFLESFSEGDDEVSPQAKACMEGVFTEDNIRLLMVSSMVNGEEAAEDDEELAPIMGQMLGCAFLGMGDMDDDDLLGDLEGSDDNSDDGDDN